MIGSIGDTSVCTDPSSATATVSFSMMVTDNESPSSHFQPVYKIGSTTITSPHRFPLGTTGVDVTANADASGNLPDAISFNVTVADNEGPQISQLHDRYVSLSPGLSTHQVSLSVSVMDNVDPPNAFTPVFSVGGQTIPPISQFPVGTTIVDVTTNADSAGNRPVPASLRVIVQDRERPVIAAIANKSADASPGRSAASVSFSTSVSDNIDPASHFTPRHSIGRRQISSPHSFSVGVTTVSVSSNPDRWGNHPSRVYFTVTVSDKEKPVIASVANKQVNTNAGLATASVSFGTTFTNNVDPDFHFRPVFGIGGQTITSPHNFPVGISAVQVTANTDRAGNSADARQFTVVVADTGKPVIAAVANKVTNTDAGKPTASVEFTTTASDNVEATGHFAPVFKIGGNMVTSPHDFPIGSTNVQITANADKSGNVPDPISFSVTVSDNGKPVIAPVADKAVNTDGGKSTASVAFATTVSDNVDAANHFATVFKIGPNAITSPHDFPVGTTKVDVTANADKAGNVPDPISFSIIVSDSGKPVIAAVADKAVKTDAGKPTASVAFATAVSDNVDAANQFTPIFKIGGDTITSPHDFPIGTTVVTVTANNDSAGNTANPVQFKVMVADADKPMIAEPEDISVDTEDGETSAVVTFKIDVTDNSGGNLQTTVTSAPTAGLNSGSKFPVGTTIMTVTATDESGNTSTEEFKVEVIEGTLPTVEIAGVPEKTNGPFTATFTFSETVNGFSIDDIVLGNASASNFSIVTVNRVFTSLINPVLDGSVTIDVPAGAVRDLAGNANVPADRVETRFDGTRPTVEILGVPTSVSATDSFDVTIQFSEAVFGFDATDVSVGNGMMRNLSLLSTGVFRASITASGSGDVTIDVVVNVAHDDVGNGNRAAPQVVVKSLVVEDTVKTIASLVEARSTLILQNMPGSQRRIDRLNGSDTISGGPSLFGFSLPAGLPPFELDLAETSKRFS